MNVEDKIKALEKAIKGKHVSDSHKDKMRKKIKELKKDNPSQKKVEKPKESTSKNKGKKTVMSVASEIRADGETWKQAVSRAGKWLKGDKVEFSKSDKAESDATKIGDKYEVTSVSDGVITMKCKRNGDVIKHSTNSKPSKKKAFVKKKKATTSTTPKKKKKVIARKKKSSQTSRGKEQDAKIQALPKGKRISKNGKVYYENRDNHSDKFQPKKKKKYKRMPKRLARGGQIEFHNSNLIITDFGIDTNGNKVMKFKFPNSKVYSVQIGDSSLPKTYLISKGVNVSDISNLDTLEIEKELVSYIGEFGSDTQKKSLRTYN